ncbi:Ankyrin repeat-containing [Pyrenophora seminiperda CCB06]|uniref:Ankyrin repeat-containing n=1 Tax=Pyrenophora seminiperda CCB06 TaxID=1302712 RepID=A0A3M7MG22_9PLEO|nr:Ankyrin repeat-containing [Pyrenophora seminiperda CCB06]
MAEAIGAAAAILQFLDVAVRLTSCLNRFCSDVRNVPRRFRELQADLRQQSDLAGQIQAQLSAQTVASPTLDRPLQEYIKLADELCKTLETLLFKQNDGFFHRSWTTICSIQKKEEVKSICDRLEEKKRTVSMCLHTENLKLTSNVVRAADRINDKIDENMSLTKIVNDSSSRVAKDVEQVLQNVGQLDKANAVSSQGTNQLVENLAQQVRAQHTTTLTNDEAIRLRLVSSNQMIETVALRTEQILQMLGSVNTIRDTKRVPMAEQLHLPSDGQAVQVPTSPHRIKKQCKCRTVSSSRRWEPLSFLRITRTFRTQHFSYCPRYRDSEQSLEVMMQIVPSWWLYAINVGARVKNWSTRAPFSMNPIVIGTTRLVHRESSPAFRVIGNIFREIEKDTAPCHNAISQLHSQLRGLVEQGQASVWDIDCQGPGRGSYSRSVYFDPAGTTCDLLASSICDGAFQEQKFLAAKNLLDLLQNNGGEASRPLGCLSSLEQGDYGLKLTKQVTSLKMFEDQIDICDLGDILPLILHEQYGDFKRCVQISDLSKLNHQSSVNGLAIIHFAVRWPTALQMLIERGVNVNPEDIWGRRPIHLAMSERSVESVRILIEADCGLFTLPHQYSFFQQAIIPGVDPQIVDLFCLALVDRHSRLLDFANAQLPFSVISRLDMVPGQLYEQYAPAIIEMLESYMINIPEALYLDGKGFYDISVDDLHCPDYFANTKLTPAIADRLWNAGFRDINQPNSHGLTPYLQTWHRTWFTMTAWFVEKGVSVTSTHRDAPLTALHVWSLSPRKDTTAKRCMDAIHGELGIPYDDCTCICSPKGCSPVKSSTARSFALGCKMKTGLQFWIQGTNPPLPLLRQYLFDFTWLLLFDYLDGNHTCCFINWKGTVEVPRGAYVLPQLGYNAYSEVSSYRSSVHMRYCKNKLPVPQLRDFAGTHSTEAFKEAIESAMSHYDEMDRPDTLPFEEQPSTYIKWIIAKGYLAVEVKDNCGHGYKSGKPESEFQNEGSENTYEETDHEYGESDSDDSGESEY